MSRTLLCRAGRQAFKHPQAVFKLLPVLRRQLNLSN